MKKRLLKTKIICILLVSIFSLTSIPVFAETENTAKYLGFTSDVHNVNNNTASSRLKSWLETVGSSIDSKFEYFCICGDLGTGHVNETSQYYWTYAQNTIKNVENSPFVKDTFFIHGNHEYSPGDITNISNEWTARYKQVGEYVKTDSYIIYSFGATQFNEIFLDENINALSEFLETNKNFPGPIFILAHFPLHAYGKYNSGESEAVHDGHAAKGSGKVIQILNKYSNVVFVWGHNHSDASETNYDKVCTDKINSTRINFTYLSAGCMSDSEYYNSSRVHGKGLVAKIVAGVVTLSYYDKDGKVYGAPVSIAMPNDGKVIAFNNVEINQNSIIYLEIFDDKGKALSINKALLENGNVYIVIPNDIYTKMNNITLFRLNGETYKAEFEKQEYKI